MVSPDFWSWFDGIAGPQLAHRTESFRKVFDYLDRFDRPVGIVETGCVRQQDNWAGDGQSTILFERYAEFHPGSAVFSVDCDPEAAALCRSLVGERVHIHAGDSLAYLKSLADHPPAGLEFLDLLYLDSFDVDFDDPLPSAIHHLKELLAIAPLVSFETLVVVDDSPSTFIGVPDGDSPVQPIRPPRIGGKGRLIAEYADQTVPSASLPSTSAAGCVWGALLVLVLGVDLGAIRRPVPGPGLGEQQHPGLRAPKARTGSAGGVVLEHRSRRVHVGVASRVFASITRTHQPLFPG
jgi:hypothetical protein